MGEIDNIICAVSPAKYCAGSSAKKAAYIKLIKKQGLDEGIKNADPLSARNFKLIYDSTSETLEPVYFWILDYVGKVYGGDKNVEKLIDSFASTPGSGHFSELQGKASQMQQESSRVLGTVNNILKGVLNLIYDLKEFKIRLSHYDASKSKDKNIKESGMLALKQIWMDKVDMQRGAGSINALSSGNLQFITLRDSFMIVNTPEEVDKLDLNDRVKRILKPRIQEFLEWQKRSEQELRKRFEIEKIYLKSQVEALKLNSRWAKPYLRAAQQLTMSTGLAGRPQMVTAFNTIMLELTLLCKDKIKVEDSVALKELPRDFKKFKGLRNYYNIMVIDFRFRGIPNKFGQHYTFGGKSEVEFKAYALNEREIELIKKKLEDSDLSDSLKFIQGMTDDSLEQLKIDIDDILGETEEEKAKKEEASDPFTALFSAFSSKKSEKKEDKKEKLKLFESKGIKTDNYAESYIRALAEAKAKTVCFDTYDNFKKSMNMASFPYQEDAETRVPQTKVEKFFGFGERHR